MTFFDHSVPTILGTTPPGAGKDWRAIALSQPGDAVLISTPYDRELLTWYLETLQQAGIKTGTIVTDKLVHALQGQKFDAFCLDTHVVHAEHAALAAIPWLNHKGMFLTWCRKNKWPIPQTQVADAPMRLGSHTFPVVYKPSVMAGGHGIVVAPDHSALQRLLQSNAVDYVLQEHLADARFYGVQVETDGVGSVTGYQITRQVIDGTAYVGTSTTIDPELAGWIWQVVSECAKEIACFRLLDFVIDIAVTAGSDARIVIMECNPRYGASTYPTKLARRLLGRDAHFEYRYVPVVTSRPQDLRFGELLFNQERRTGLLPIDISGLFPGAERQEIGVVAFARSREERLVLLRRFQEQNDESMSVCA